MFVHVEVHVHVHVYVHTYVYVHVYKLAGDIEFAGHVEHAAGPAESLNLPSSHAVHVPPLGPVHTPHIPHRACRWHRPPVRSSGARRPPPAMHLAK